LDVEVTTTGIGETGEAVNVFEWWGKKKKMAMMVFGVFEIGLFGDKKNILEFPVLCCGRLGRKVFGV
jgi:hypothetical protein